MAKEDSKELDVPSTSHSTQDSSPPLLYASLTSPTKGASSYTSGSSGSLYTTLAGLVKISSFKMAPLGSTLAVFKVCSLGGETVDIDLWYLSTF